jgi:hypothetical protein
MPTAPARPSNARVRRLPGPGTRIVILGVLAAVPAGGCASDSSRPVPRDQPILTGLGADACIPERFAAAWQDRTSAAESSAPLPGPVGGTGGS